MCDYDNGRVLELTELGEAELQQMHGRTHCMVAHFNYSWTLQPQHPAAEVHWRVGLIRSMGSNDVGPAQKAPDQRVLWLPCLRLVLDGPLVHRSC